MKDTLARPPHVARIILLCLALLGFALVLSGCQSGERMGDFVDADWGRGEPLGHANLSNPPALATSPSSDVIFGAWPVRHEIDGERFWALHLVRLNAAGQIELDRDLAIDVTNPNQIYIALDQAGMLQMAWIEKKGDVGRLFLTRLNQDGDVLAGPILVSDPAWQADSYSLIAAPDGTFDLVWSESLEDYTLHYVRTSQDGTLLGESVDLGRPGFDPTIRYDATGQGHLVWLETPDFGERGLWYAPLDSATHTLASEPVQLEQYAAPLGLTAHRPSLGFDRTSTYVFWSIERRGGGLTSPAAWSYYVHFPVGQPELVTESIEIELPATIHFSIVDVDSSFDVHKLAPGGYLGRVAPFIYLPDTNEQAQDQLAAAFSVQLIGRTKSTVQIVLTIWQDGELVGYQIAGKTSNGSLKPNLAADASGNLHVAWIDTAGFGDYAVFLASTADTIASRTNRLRPVDILYGVLDFVWGLAQAMSFLPLAFVWIFIPVVLQVGYVLVRAEGRLNRTGAKVLLGISILIYVLVKYWFQPGWLASLPLPASLPRGLVQSIQLLAPLLVSVVSSLITWRYAHKRDTASVFSAFAVFAVCDALITMIIYVPGIMAE